MQCYDWCIGLFKLSWFFSTIFKLFNEKVIINSAFKNKNKYGY